MLGVALTGPYGIRIPVTDKNYRTILSENAVEIRKGAFPPEEFIKKSFGYVLWSIDLSSLDLSDTTLENIELGGANLGRTDFKNAT